MIGFGKERFPYPGRIQWWICLRKSQMEMSSFDHMFGDVESIKKTISSYPSECSRIYSCVRINELES